MFVDDKWITDSDFEKQFNDYLADWNVILNYEDYIESESVPNLSI